MTESDARGPSDFIREIVREDIRTGKHGGRVHTRFPPEPSGYLHIGHAYAICISFGIAQEFGGLTNLRFDDTNPVKEDVEYVNAIQQDIRWLGFDWGDRLYFASDYFDQLYDFAEQLIHQGVAYVCDLDQDEIREYRGTLTEAGRNSPYRERTVDENLDLFRRMRAGEYPDGARTLRAKIDMAAPNIVLRDPVLYRIKHAHHDRTGDKWCIYPMYDYTHCISDSIEGITHSLCSLEFVANRDLYDWTLDQLGIFHSRQYEFGRQGLTYTIMSKRHLIRLVEEGHVRGWDDPRMPTVAGMRRLGCTPESIRTFARALGISRTNSSADIAMLEHYIRQDLNEISPRRFGILRPLKLVIDNYAEGQVEEMDALTHPARPEMGTRPVPFSREIWIESSDFMEDPPRKYYRLAPGQEVRLRFAYLVTCTGVVKDEDGNIVEVHCTYDPATKGGDAPDGRKVRGTIHWLSAAHAVPVEVRLYDRLFATENPYEAEEGQDFISNLNPSSLEIVADALVEPSLADAPAGSRYQFERHGYFCVDPDSTAGRPVFNRTVSLRDSWAKMVRKA